MKRNKGGVERSVTRELIEQVERQKGGRKVALFFSVILSVAKDLRLSSRRSFAVYAAQDDGRRKRAAFRAALFAAALRSAPRRVKPFAANYSTRWCCRSIFALSKWRSRSSVRDQQHLSGRLPPFERAGRGRGLP